MKIRFALLFASCINFAFASASSSIDKVETSEGFIAYQRKVREFWYQDDDMDLNTGLTKFKSECGNKVWHVAIPHKPCEKTLYCRAYQDELSLHRMRLEIEAGEPWKTVYYAMLDDKNLAVICEYLKDNTSRIEISLNTVVNDCVLERALALYALANKRLDDVYSKNKDSSFSYKVHIKLDTFLEGAESQMAKILTSILQGETFGGMITDTKFREHIKILGSKNFM